jgi:3-phenylpropionate/cinnamic acid dioxygenase small subunit
MPNDECEIANLLYRYAELIDAGDFSGVGELFSKATVHWGLRETQGPAAVEAQLHATTRRYEDGTPHTAHIITNPLIEVDGDTATARSRYSVYQATDALPLQPIIIGRYTDRFARDADGWHFTDRTYGVDLLGNLREHLPEAVIRVLDGE